MKTYNQWLVEREARTRLGIYPAAYAGNAGRCPLYGAATSAGNLNAYTVGIRRRDNKRNKGRNPWAKSFSYVE